jgi:hypothetical protein
LGVVVKTAEKEETQTTPASPAEERARERREEQQALFRKLNKQLMSQLERSQHERQQRRARLRIILSVVGCAAVVAAGIVAFRFMGASADEKRAKAKIKAKVVRAKPTPVPSLVAVVKDKPAATAVKASPEKPAPPKKPPAPPPAVEKPKPAVKPKTAKAPAKPEAPPPKPKTAKAPKAPTKPKAPPPAPTKPAPTAKAKKETTGRLRLVVTPPVTVLLEGRELGKTPLTTEVPTGSHDLELVEPYLGIRVKRRVWVRGGQLTVQTWKLGRGKLVVPCKPSVTVWVDKGEHGPAPATIDLYVGSHTVDLVTGGKRVRRHVTVRSGRTTRVKCPKPKKPDVATPDVVEPPDDPGISG